MTACRRVGVVAVCLACSVLVACTNSVSPAAVVIPGVVLPEPPAVRWHGVSAEQVSGSTSHWNLEDLILRTDGVAEIAEYEGPQQRETGTWDLAGREFITIDFPTFCRRSGTVEGDRMSLTCSTTGRTWRLTFLRQ